MPTCDLHQLNYINNLEVAENMRDFERIPNDWIIILYFYSAVHLVEKILSDQGVHSTTHVDRFKNVKTHLRPVLPQYQALYNESIEARYNCTPMTSGKVVNAKKNLEEITEKLTN
jgi:hypothetical protein